MRWLRRLLGIGLFVGVLVLGWRFAAGNDTPVTVDYLLGEVVGLSLWVVLLAAFALGAALAGAAGLIQIARLGLTTRRYRKSVRGLESELHQLRNLPLSEEPPRGGPGGGEGPLPRGALERGA